MSGATLLDLALRGLALAFVGLGARLALRVGGRVALDLAVYAGAAAFAAAALAPACGPFLGALLALSLATGLGGSLGALGGFLDPARAAAFGLIVQLAADALAPRLGSVTGGHMGRALGAPDPGLGAIGLALALAGLMILDRSSSRPVWRRARARARLLVEAPALHAALGHRVLPVRAALGAGSAALAGAGGLLHFLALEHLHHRAFGLELGLDALAIGLLTGPAPRWAPLLGLAWVGLRDGLAGVPDLPPLILGLGLAGGALVLARRAGARP